MDKMWKMYVFTLDSDFIDAADDIECLESILYGDLSSYDGPRIVQIPLTEEELIAQVSYLMKINADCFGTEDKIELVVC